MILRKWLWVPLLPAVIFGGCEEGDLFAKFVWDSSVTEMTLTGLNVDVESGQVQLTKFTSAHDVGTILNPVGHQGQIDGAVMQGIGYALTEELRYDEGHVTTLSMGEYKMPVMIDMPELRTVLVESESGGPTPYGGKSIGEQGISSVAPAIINAILDATGVSMTEIPVSSEKLFRAMEERSAGS